MPDQSNFTSIGLKNGTAAAETLASVVINASAVVDIASLVDGAGATSASIPVAGAALGDFVLISCSLDLQGLLINAYVDAANSVKFRIQNETTGTIDLASATFKVRVVR